MVDADPTWVGYIEHVVDACPVLQYRDGRWSNVWAGIAAIPTDGSVDESVLP